MTNTGGTPAGWYHAPGDAEGTQRYWDGGQWIGDPQAVPQQATPQAPAAPQNPPAPDATVAYTPSAADPSAGQPPAYGAPPAGGQQPPAYGSPPPGAGAPPGYTAFGDPGAAGVAGTLAEPWERLAGRFIDGVLVGIVFVIIGRVVAVALDNILGGLIAGVIGVAIGTAYEVMMTSKLGATLGKQAFNMRIVNDPDGSKVDDSVMIKRFMPSIVIGLIGAVPILGLLRIPLGLIFVILSLVWIFTDEKRRSVYDKFGKTYVIVEA